MTKQWAVRDLVSPDLVRQILFYRGVKTDEEIEKFLNPDYEQDIGNPFGILNMDKAVERILTAIKENQKIVIFGDYDADGVCASVIMNDFFKKIGFENFHFHIPDRNLDGYGLTPGAVDEFIQQKFNLIITFDCGITDCDEVEKAKSSGIDVIITDHHLPPEKLPNAFAIVNSKQENDLYFKYLCGAGVAFKLTQALIKKGDFNITVGWEKWLLDAVAIATVADMVPLTGENRTLVYFGLQVLKKTNRVGLMTLYKKFNIDVNNLTEDDIAFSIAPKINVASRLGHANSSFELMTTNSTGEANWITSHLESLNNERKDAVDNIANVVEELMQKEAVMPNIIVVGDMGWHPGVLGIAANRILEKYGRPVFVWGKAEAKQIKGSCRSDGSVNLVELMKKISEDILIERGGHALAGGFTVKDGELENFLKEIKGAYESFEKQEVEKGVLHIDKELTIDDVNWDNYELIKKMGPFGIENPKPVFLFSDIEIDSVKKFGNGGIHLQLNFKKSDGKIVSAIGFFISAEDKFDLIEGGKIDLVASMEKSTFRNFPELRLKIVDIRKK